MKRAILVAALLLCGPALAQQSASFKLQEHAFNAGGHPREGTVLTSTSFKISFGALGDGLAVHGLTSPSIRTDAGFITLFPPPGEVMGLLFTDKQTLAWDVDNSIGDYNLYRDLMSTLLGFGFGQCEQQNLPDETAADSDAVPANDGFFYLVTSVNRLAEEGTKGFQSSSSNDAPKCAVTGNCGEPTTERTGNVCP